MGPEDGTAGPLRQALPMRAAPDEEEAPPALRRDVRILGGTLGQVLEESGGRGLLEDVERLRRATIALRVEPSAANRQRVVEIVGGLDLERAEAVARAFTVWFQLVNLAEEHHRVRTLRERSRAGGPVKDSLEATVRELRGRVGEETLAALLARLEVTPVLTAHPTEARRRAVVEALERIGAQADRLDDARLAPAEERDVRRRLFEEVTILWRTAQLRDARPTPLDEVRTVMAVFDGTLFRVAPLLYRDLDEALEPGSGTRPSLVRPFLRLGSWVGGDRDGNPHVTAAVTRTALEVQAEHALRGLEAVARRIGRALTVSERTTPPSAELLASLAADERAFPRVAGRLRTRAPREPHRRKLLLVAERLAATRSGTGGGYPGPGALLEDLELVQRSLAGAGADRLAYGELQQLVWQVDTFGFHLASLEVRQHAGVHERALEELAPGTAGDLAALARLATEGWPAAGAGGERSARTEEVLGTLRTIAGLQRRFGVGACRRYVVSFTRRAADVVAVRALARLAVPDGGLELDVIPLFESRSDLQAARGVLEELAAAPGGLRLAAAGDRVEVMLGYSDSAKDVGFLAANIALYRAQADLVGWAAGAGVDLVLFHGRGGAMGRGGGPANRAVRGQAPGSVQGRFKITEQGEVIFARYGNRQIARRHLEQVTSAVLLASAPPAEPPEAPAPALLDRMAGAAENAWKELVTAEGFGEFFYAVTPLEELTELQIGSRPARRVARRDIDSLRAIPWVFAWSQNRCNLPGWYGLGSGLEAVASEPGGLERLRALYRRWPFFNVLLDNAEMSLAKADMPIAQLYLAFGERPDLAKRIEREFDRTLELVLAVTGNERLLGRRPVLRQAVALRNPYVDALSFLQLRFLTELRQARPDPTRTEQAGADQARRDRTAELVLLTVNGVAAGLQNTG
jgi:phosphoenolpyruvate carboxylase